MSKKGLSQRSLLQEISIRGLGVIDNAIVEFKPGLNVITGETGAGKTMLLSALSLILGGKADSDLVRIGNERATTSGRFALPKPIPASLSQVLEEHDIVPEDDCILLNRSVAKDGKSRALAGGAPTTVSTLNDLSGELIEIHGQHSNLVLSKANKQREILDGFCGPEFSEALVQYQENLDDFTSIKSKISELTKALGDKERLITQLREVDADFKKLKPRETELSELDNTISKLESIEDLRVAVSGAVAALSDEEMGALNGLQQSKRFLQGIKGKDSDLDALHDRISDSLFNLVDAAADLDRYLSDLSADPNALESALQRRSLLLTFLKKYGKSPDRALAFVEAIEFAREASTRIADLSGGDETIEKLKIELQKSRTELILKAKKLSKMRSDRAAEFSKLVEAELHALSMPKARLDVVVTSKACESDSDFQGHGIDDVSIEFSAHGGTELLPIMKAASGGELSRLMLGIEVVVANTYPVGTYIFDEVDAGVGGKAALDVGRRLKKLAKQAQVIVVTHLPQVAIWADHHIIVEKNIDGAVTESSIRALDDSQREIEIARMLSGLESSEHAQEHARELLNLRLAEKA